MNVSRNSAQMQGRFISSNGRWMLSMTSVWKHGATHGKPLPTGSKQNAEDPQRTHFRKIQPPHTSKNSKMAPGKAPSNLTPNQQIKVEWIAKTDPRLYRAYMLKEALRLVFYNNTLKMLKRHWMHGYNRPGTAVYELS